MFRLGAVLAVLGFGSALLHFTSVQFRLLMWAEPAQPVLGLCLGAAGVVVLVLKLARGNQNPQQQQPGGPGQYAASPAGFAPAGQQVPGAGQPFEPQFEPQFAPQFAPPPHQPPVAQPMPQPAAGAPTAEPVLGRPQFAPQPVGGQRPVPPPPARPSSPPQFPPAPRPANQQPPGFGPQG